MNKMLDPQGRLSPAAFREMALLLIAIGAIIGLVPLVAPAVSFLSYAGLLLIYPWVVIWVKRFHDAGKPGWMFLMVLVPWFATGLAVNFLIIRRLVDVPPPDPTNIMGTMTAQMQATALPGAIAGVVIALIYVFAVNAMLKSDPGPNAYDPPAHLR